MEGAAPAAEAEPPPDPAALATVADDESGALVASDGMPAGLTDSYKEEKKKTHVRKTSNGSSDGQGSKEEDGKVEAAKSFSLSGKWRSKRRQSKDHLALASSTASAASGAPAGVGDDVQTPARSTSIGRRFSSGNAAANSKQPPGSGSWHGGTAFVDMFNADDSIDSSLQAAAAEAAAASTSMTPATDGLPTQEAPNTAPQPRRRMSTPWGGSSKDKNASKDRRHSSTRGSEGSSSSPLVHRRTTPKSKLQAEVAAPSVDRWLARRV